MNAIDLSPYPQSQPGQTPANLITEEKISIEELERLKKVFFVWIAGNVIEDLIETFGLCLDKLIFFLLIGEKFKQSINSVINVTPEEETNIYKSLATFELQGNDKKLTFLKDNYGVQTSLSEYLNTLKVARNCLTHRLGVVGYGQKGENDFNNENKLTIRWRFFNCYQDTPSKHLELSKVHDNDLKKGIKVTLKLEEQERSFNKGERINLSPIELEQICLNFRDALDELIKKTENYLMSIKA
jgi:hypothetical protein